MNDKTMALRILPTVMTVLQDMASPLQLLASANSFALTQRTDRMLETDRAGFHCSSGLNDLSVTDCFTHSYLTTKSELQSVTDAYDDESGDSPLYTANSFEFGGHDAAYACNVTDGNSVQVPCYDNNEERKVFNSWRSSGTGYGCILCGFLHVCILEGISNHELGRAITFAVVGLDHKPPDSPVTAVNGCASR